MNSKLLREFAVLYFALFLLGCANSSFQQNKTVLSENIQKITSGMNGERKGGKGEHYHQQKDLFDGNTQGGEKKQNHQ